IRDITDAHRVLEAVRMDILPLVRRRLLPQERAQLQSGNVFVWEESEPEDGLVRWTDGRRWSQSRMRGDYLYYEEKMEKTDAEKQAKAARRAMKVSECSASIPGPPKRKDRPSKADGLTKQTYSVTIQLPGSAATKKKWHIVAYFSARNCDILPVVEDYEYLRDIRVPAGVFLNTNRPVNGSLEKFPTPQAVPGGNWSAAERYPPAPGANELKLDFMLSCQPPSGDRAVVLPAISPAHSPVTLPPISSLGYHPQRPPIHSHSQPAAKVPPRYSWSVCSDDRRILDRFPVVI
ncbi:Gti1/Pac2 family-domain-containing protein, partial [Mycena maculata]